MQKRLRVYYQNKEVEVAILDEWLKSRAPHLTYHDIGSMNKDNIAGAIFALDKSIASFEIITVKTAGYFIECKNKAEFFRV